jgi:hypothetical protein
MISVLQKFSRWCYRANLALLHGKVSCLFVLAKQGELGKVPRSPEASAYTDNNLNH